jgi:hypothetical protein
MIKIKKILLGKITQKKMSNWATVGILYFQNVESLNEINVTLLVKFLYD